MVFGINPGRLNKRVSVFRYMDTTTVLGETRPELTHLRDIWCEIKPTRGKEILEMGKETGEFFYKITCRYLPLTDDDVLVWQGRQFLITAVTDLMEEHKYLELLCTEKKDKKVQNAD